MIVIRRGKAVQTVQTADTILDAIRATGMPFDAPCGGRGVCGKCRVFVRGLTDCGEGWVTACQARPTGDCTVYLPPPVQSELPAAHTVALDIGTTTVCAAAVDAGAAVGLGSERNAQAAFGADVMSRITAAVNGHTAAMRDAVVTQLAGFTRGAKKLYIVGNTVMLHILWGENPSGLGTYPFTPVFTGVREGVLAGVPAVTLPCLSAFIGADALAGAAHLRLRDGELLVDLGTNCEMIFQSRGRYYACSAAAGPALEGAGLACGMAGGPGAIDSVFYDRGLRYTVTGGGEARGITGAGVFDLIAYMRAAGLVDAAGCMHHSLCGVFRLGEAYVTQNDVRAFQLAKAAVRAGLDLLCARAEAKPDRIYLAGGLGLRLNPDSAYATGLLPEGVPVESVGNAALDGCIEAATDERFVAQVEEVRAAAETVPLQTEAFDAAFVRYTEIGENQLTF